MHQLCPCGRPLDAGRTPGANQGSRKRCRICDVQPPCIVLRPGRRNQPRPGVCTCCGRSGNLAAHGLITACYQRRRAHSKLDEWRAYYQELTDAD